jgi:protein-S-isoprenylcysteine O-methyltransferase Ste14
MLLPGVIAGYIPWTLFGLSRTNINLSVPRDIAGMLLICLGALLLAACILEFARSGQGTLSPADPPRKLVVRGLYRYVRNPMYLSVTTVILGEALLANSWALTAYWTAWFLAVNAFVLGYEEPALRRLFGHQYEEYARRVGRWIPTFRPDAKPR